ncbi:MAG: ATP-binding protein [Elusimicrobia bacterium]|nr:ATP-binding protein [Elusimicrobiota bacterium]
MNRIELTLTKARRTIHAPKTAKVAEFLNLWSLRDGVVLGVDLSLSSAYELEIEDLRLADPARADLFEAQARSFLNALPAETTVQFIVQVRRGDTETIREFREANTYEGQDDLSRLLIERKCAEFEGKFLQRRRYFLYVTSRPKGGAVPVSPLIPRFKPVVETAARGFDAQRRREHEALDRVVAERLHSMGLRFRRLESQELLDLVYRHLNPAKPGLPMSRLSPLRTLREQVATTPVEEEFDHVRVGDAYFRGVSLLRLPETAHPGYMWRLLDCLWPDCDLVLNVHALDTEAAVSRLKLKNNVTRTLAFSAWTKNYEAERKHLELDELLTEIRATAQRLFRFSLSVIVRAPSLDGLRDKTSAVLGAFHDFASAEGLCDDMNHGRLFLGAIPGHARLNDRQFYMQTNSLSGFLPLSGAWKGSRRKTMLVETPLGELVALDPFDPELPAKHGLVIGTTGSGKSFATNFILSAFLASSKDTHVVTIDVGGSYRKLCRAYGGEYLEVELSERFGFNPFPPKSEIAPGGEFDGDAIAYLSLLISRMCLKPGEVVGTVEKAFLESAIKAAYKDREEATLSDVRRELARLSAARPRAKHFADALELWTSGMYGKLFDRKGRLNVDNRLVVFDLQNLENHSDLQAVYFFVIRSVIWGKLRNLSLRKIVAVDEGWKFFDDQVGSDLIQGLYRTARKFNGAVFSVSQSPQDFLGTKAAGAIVANSYVKFVLKLSKGHELLSQFDLNPAEIESVRLLQSKPKVFSDILLKFGARSVVIRIEPGSLDYWLCTTDAEDRLAEEKVRAANPGLSETKILLKLAQGRPAGAEAS